MICQEENWHVSVVVRQEESLEFFHRKKTDLVEEILFFPITARRIASAGESNDGNDGSPYQCPEPGCDEDFKTQADHDLHMNQLVHHVSPGPTNMT